MPPTVTVAVCTWNRAKWLDRLLTGMRDLRLPPGVEWELLVVDNNCTDDTAAVAAAHARHLPLRVAFEPTPGISFARNRAVTEAQGEYLLWTDDDARVEPDWAEKLLEAFDRFDADLVFGRVDPEWEAGRPPPWYTPEFRGMFAVLDHGGPPRVLTDRRLIGFNVNLAFRRSLVERLGAYRVDIGAGRMAGGEDQDLCHRSYDAGLTVAYQPEAVVKHYIPASRCTKAFYRRYMWDGSPHHLRLLRDEAAAGRVPRLLGLPRYFVRRQFDHVAGFAGGVLRQDPGQTFFNELKLIRFAGLFYAMLTGRTPQQITRRAGD